MRYSNYDLDQLMEYKQYGDICKRFLALAPDLQTTEKLESILYLGGYKDYNPSGGIGKNNPIIDVERRIGLAYLILRNPDTFDQIVDNKIVYFHGTNANALPRIIKYGINSVDNLRMKGVEVSTGEQWSRIDGKRSFISFTDVLDVAEGYSTLSSEKQTELSFPIVFGTTKENILSCRFSYVKSDVPEVGVKDFFPKEAITCIMVPTNKIEIIRKIVDPGMLILPMDDVQNRFYSVVEHDFFELYINEEKYQEMKNCIFNKEEELQGIKSVVVSRTIEKIKSKLYQLEKFIKGDNLDESRIIK